MKVFILLVLAFAACNSYTWWDAWHNVPTTFVPTPSNATSQKASLSGWVQNGPNNPHYSGIFDDYSNIYTQYMFWKTSDPDQIVFCAPKYYLFNQTHCKRDPYYIPQASIEYCIPHTFGIDGAQTLCNLESPWYPQFECCYTN